MKNIKFKFDVNIAVIRAISITYSTINKIICQTSIMKKNIILTICISIILLAIIISPDKYINVSFNAIVVWGKVLLPSLFPFFVFTKLLTSLGYVKKLSSTFSPITYKLYKSPPISSYVFLMSIITGYPVGSKLTADLYNNNYISKQEAKKIITFTSNSGPMFIVGSVGIGMLLNKTAGYIILISHIIGAMLNGLLYRNLKTEDNSQKKFSYNNKEIETNLSSIVMDSIFSILLIGGIIVVAFIIIELLNSINIFYPINFILSKLNIDTSISSSIFDGIFEITKGCLSTSNLNISLYSKTIICSSIISFGGLSTTLQAMAFLKDIVSYKFFIGQKITHMILSTLICCVFALILI